MIASFREITGFQVVLVFIHIVRGRPGGLLQFSKEEAVKIFLASVSSGIRTMCVWPNIEKRRAWTRATYVVAWLSVSPLLSRLTYSVSQKNPPP